MPARPLTSADVDDALLLYGELTVGPKTFDPADFDRVLAHPGTSIFGSEQDGRIAAMATVHVLPNVSWNGRPYALIENVVTRADMRGNGFGRETLEAARDAAWAADCYKIMLLTGQGRGAVGFYETVGFRRDNKFGMVLRRT